MIKYTLEDHAEAGVSKLLATNGGAHIYNITVSSDTDNGNIIAKGGWKSFDNYEEAEAISFNGVIRAKAANGNFYVEVLEDLDSDEALLVYNTPVNSEQYNKEFQHPKHFFVGEGQVARAHELRKGDVFELSALGFDGEPVVGASITSVSDKKLVVGSVPSV